MEEIYSKCLGRECGLRNIPFVKELRIFLEYKGLVFTRVGAFLGALLSPLKNGPG
jgi:hypothetical protein